MSVVSKHWGGNVEVVINIGLVIVGCSFLGWCIRGGICEWVPPSQHHQSFCACLGSSHFEMVG